MELQVAVFDSALQAFYTRTSGAPARELRLSLHKALHRTVLLPPLLWTGKGSTAWRAPVGTSQP